MRSLIKAAREYSGTECNIMIQGETGTGKELFAQSIHNAGPRAAGPFVAVNCAALPGALLESELFGYAPGAFTGALRSGKTGLFELAHNGTLFLDEITELDVFLQARLLRVLQAKEIMRVGDSRVIPLDVRVIAATNRNPQQEVRLGRMRADLFFRLNVLDIAVPPLRERREDIAPLFRYYLGHYGKKYGRTPRAPSRRMLDALENRAWPGNVRELENLAEKYVTLGGLPLEDLLPDTASCAPSSGPESETLDSAVSRHIHETLRREGGNIARTAARLAVDRNTVKRWLAKEGHPGL
jgi:transcriptional regulator with PAS, ATPase and Fis domain